MGGLEAQSQKGTIVFVLTPHSPVTLSSVLPLPLPRQERRSPFWKPLGRGCCAGEGALPSSTWPLPAPRSLAPPEAEEALLGRRDASSQNKWGESARWLWTEPTW